MKFIPRLTSPSNVDKNWLHYTMGGTNYCIKINGGPSVLPNCVGYAWGRWSELLGKLHKLSRGNAENWYGNTADGYVRGQVPKVGAVACWRKGQAGNSADGAGHVAIVEEVYPDGSFKSSNSGYSGTRFWLQKFNKSNNYYVGNAYAFQGFIYLPIEFEEDKPTKTVEELANEVLAGKWGNNPERKNDLIAAGYDYSAIQIRVNQILAEKNKPVTPTPKPSTGLKKGDKVRIIGPGNINSYGTGINTGKQTIGWEREVLNDPSRLSGRQNPVQVGNKSGTTGWFKEKNLLKLK